MLRIFAALCVAVLSCTITLAGVPKKQTTKNVDEFRSTINILKVLALDSIKTGTGIVIGSKVEREQGFLCILTADHNLSKDDKAAGALVDVLLMGSRNPDDSHGEGKIKPITRIWRQGRELNNANRWDLAVCMVSWGAPDAEFTALADSARAVSVYDKDHTYFTSAGHGQSGDLTKNGTADFVGYLHDDDEASHIDLKKRFWSNAVTEAKDNDDAGDGYKHPLLKWKLHKENEVIAEGMGLPGDSGSGMHFTDELNFGDDNLVGLSDNIRGIVTQVDIRRINAKKYIVAYDDFGYGVQITADVKKWIDGRCAAVPEPSAFVAAGAGLVAFLRFRRK